MFRVVWAVTCASDGRVRTAGLCLVPQGERNRNLPDGPSWRHGDGSRECPLAVGPGSEGGRGSWMAQTDFGLAPFTMAWEVTRGARSPECTAGPMRGIVAIPPS